MTSLVTKNGAAQVLSQFTGILHDGAGNRTSVTANLPAVSGYNGTTAYTYDAKDQLTQEQSTRNGGYTNTFAYDPAGNPLTFKGVTKTYNANNQQTGTGFAYDAMGNPTTYKGAMIGFDPENRMTAYGTSLTAGYTGDGLRAWKQNSSGARTYFLYDGLVPILDMNTSGAITVTATFGPNGLVSHRTSTTPTPEDF